MNLFWLVVQTPLQWLPTTRHVSCSLLRSLSGRATPFPELSKRLKGIERGELDFAAAQATASSRPTENADRPWMPTWLFSFFTGAKPDTKQEGGMSWADLEKGANLTVEGFKQYCYQYRLSTPAPAPKVPPIVRFGSARKRPYDNARLQYLRMCQHEKIAAAILPAQAVEIERDPVAAMKNMELLKLMAKQSGYTIPEVQDCIASMVTLRGTALKLLRWKQMGRPMPSSYAEVKLVTHQMTNILKKEERKKFLEQHLSTCPLGAKRRFFRTPTCPRTGLPWARCCLSQNPSKDLLLAGA